MSMDLNNTLLMRLLDHERALRAEQQQATQQAISQITDVSTQYRAMDREDQKVQESREFQQERDQMMRQQKVADQKRMFEFNLKRERAIGDRQKELETMNHLNQMVRQEQMKKMGHQAYMQPIARKQKEVDLIRLAKAYADLGKGPIANQFLPQAKRYTDIAQQILQIIQMPIPQEEKLRLTSQLQAKTPLPPEEPRSTIPQGEKPIGPQPPGPQEPMSSQPQQPGQSFMTEGAAGVDAVLDDLFGTTPQKSSPRGSGL